MVDVISISAWRAILSERRVGFDGYADVDADDQMYILYDFECSARPHNSLTHDIRRLEVFSSSGIVIHVVHIHVVSPLGKQPIAGADTRSAFGGYASIWIYTVFVSSARLSRTKGPRIGAGGWIIPAISTCCRAQT